LKTLVLAATRDSLKEPVTFRVDRGIAAGFRVSRNGEEVYYDFTDQSIAEVLQEFLNPAIRNLLEQNG
jgi:vacuolar-type H+-ATPase subunit E/Vma4